MNTTQRNALATLTLGAALFTAPAAFADTTPTPAPSASAPTTPAPAHTPSAKASANAVYKAAKEAFRTQMQVYVAAVKADHAARVTINQTFKSAVDAAITAYKAAIAGTPTSAAKSAALTARQAAVAAATSARSAAIAALPALPTKPVAPTKP